MRKAIFLIASIAWTLAGPSLADDSTQEKVIVYEGGYPNADPAWLPYFSGKGQNLAVQMGIPNPPVKLMTVANADPPRNVSAENWKPAFCVDWDDGCTRCMRSKIDGEVACGQYDPRSLARICTKRDVICNVGESRGAENICSLIVNIVHRVFIDGAREKVITRQWLSWNYDINARRGWELIEEDPPLPDKRTTTWDARQVKQFTSDYVCERTYDKSNSSAVYVSGGN